MKANTITVEELRAEPTRRLQVDIPAELMDWLIATAGPGKLSKLVATVLQAVREEAEQAAQS